MSNVKKPLTHRQRQALSTQKLIVDSARNLFLEQGYVATTIEAISTQAGVAVSTVYAIFGNKRRILRAIREAWHQESGQAEIYQQAIQEPDPSRRIILAAHATRRQWETSAHMIRIYKGAAAADQDAAAELAEALHGRRAFITQFIDSMGDSLRSDLNPPQLTDIYFALTLPEIYIELVENSGWSPAAYEAWLAKLLQQQLLAVG